MTELRSTTLSSTLLSTLLLAMLAGAAPADTVPPTYNRVSLDESAEAEVDNDLLVAVLFAQAEGRDAGAPADEVNRAIDAAVTLAGRHPEVKTQTLGYHTSPVYQKNTLKGWRVSQSLRLESRDSRLLSDLIAQLQNELKVQSIGYEVSDEQRRRHLDGLTETAIGRFQARAAHVASSLGRKSYRIVRIAINDGRPQPMPVARGMLMEAASADAGVVPPRLEAGTQKMTV